MAKSKSRRKRQKGQGVKKAPVNKSAPAKRAKRKAHPKPPKPPKKNKTALRARKNAQRAASRAKKKAAKRIKAPSAPKLLKPQKHETRSLSEALKGLRNVKISITGKRPKNFKPLFGGKPEKKRAATPPPPKKPPPKKAPPKGRTRIPQVPRVEPRVNVEKLKSGEIRTIAFDVPYKNLNQWLEALERNPTLNGQIPEGARLGFRFFGNNSLQTFNSVKDALLRVASYNATLDALDVGNPEDQAEIYRNIEFVIVDSEATWQRENNIFLQSHNQNRRKRKRQSRKYGRMKWERLKVRNPAAYQQQLAAKRARAKARYERLKHDPAFKARAAAASRKYYARNKG